MIKLCLLSGVSLLVICTVLLLSALFFIHPKGIARRLTDDGKSVLILVYLLIVGLVGLLLFISGLLLLPGPC